MTPYRFDLIRADDDDVPDRSVLLRRPFAEIDTGFEADARRFVPGPALETAINTAIAVGEPLLVTGEPGTGKTQAAYYIAYKLGIEPIIHFQVKSDTTAKDLLYHFDTVRYFHDAHVTDSEHRLDKNKYVERRALWEAFEAKHPMVLLIDEIDKAPRDFPNDLLHELDKMEFKVVETGQVVRAERAKRPILVITSNSERRLPEPFLRRCVYHHVRFDEQILQDAVRRRRDMCKPLSDDFIALALRRFMALRNEIPLRKMPSTGEFLVWLRVLALTVGSYPERLDTDLSRLPYIGVLLKDHQDIADIQKR